MGKESESDGLKKRKKTSLNNSGGGGSNGTPKDITDMYKTIITFEEQEAMGRSSDADSVSFFSSCDMIRESMEKIAKLKSNDDPSAKHEIRELQIQTSLAFIELKKLNRMEKFRTKFARDLLTNAKSGVDSRHLQLQNLLYEVMHLKKEVIKCLQFKSKDELIELVSQEEFYREAPDSISRPEITKSDVHQLRLSRLEWELTQRKQLAALCDELTESKKGVASNIETKQLRLDNLAPQLRTILDTSKPLQDSLGIALDKIHDEHQKASQLPSPLYVLYAKTAAYRDAYDVQLSVNVEGDEDEARRVNNLEGTPDSDSDQETQLENIPDEGLVHKKRHHRISKEARQEEKKTKILERHPLSVEIVIYVKNDAKLMLRFYYMNLLKIITVESHLETDQTNRSVSAGDILLSESILRVLYPNDVGQESPNPANSYHLTKHNFGPFPTLGVGIPYKWAQHMAGLHFITANSREQTISVNELAHNSVENVIKEIKKRIRARLELSNEIRQLESGNFFTNTASSSPSIVPLKLSTNLVQFAPSGKNQASDSSPVSTSTTDIFYEAVLRRGNNELVAEIAIKPDYPKVSPVLSLKMNLKGPGVTDILRDIEREVNVMWEKESPPTLSLQLQRLCSCFDIYLETEGIVPREKIFFHPFKGKNRARPYKYLSLGGGVFTQR